MLGNEFGTQCVPNCARTNRPAVELAADNPTVVRAVDGDTLLLSDQRRVRLIGVDTPEHHPSAKLNRDARENQRGLWKDEGLPVL